MQLLQSINQFQNLKMQSINLLVAINVLNVRQQQIVLSKGPKFNGVGAMSSAH